FAVTAADRALKLGSEMHEDGIAPRLIPLGLVVNRYRPRSVEHQYRLAELRDLFDDKVLEPVIEERLGLQQAQGGPRPLHRSRGGPVRPAGAGTPAPSSSSSLVSSVAARADPQGIEGTGAGA